LGHINGFRVLYIRVMPKSGLIFLALAVTACSAANGPAPTTVQDIGAIERVREDWAADWNAKRLDDILKLYAPDAVFLRPNAPRTTGIEEIRALLAGMLETHTPHIVLHGVTIEGSANLAYDSGTYDETITSGGATRIAKGDYLMIVKRQANGRWLIVQHAWTDASAPESSR
jgi:uncharacterized protein (TIGR02246 family)